MPQSAARASSRSPLRGIAAALATAAVVASALVVALAPAERAAAVGPVIDCSTDPSILNTGYDGAGGRLTSGQDSGWTWGGGLGGPPSTVPAWAVADIVSAPYATWAVSPYNNASWIAHNSTGDHTGTGPAQFYYRYLFELAPTVVPAGFSVNLDFYADNSVAEIWINGVAQSGNLPEIPQAPSNPYLHNGFAPGMEASTTLNQNWQAGQNELVVVIQSIPGFEGFLAQTTSAGFCEDYGDAPASYGTTKTDSGASHILRDFDGVSTGSLMLGSTVDTDADASGLTGAGDDSSDLDDENGVTAFPAVSDLSSDYSMTVDLTNTTGSGATLAGWIDFNDNGLFDASERATATVGAVATQATLNWSGISPVAGATYARFRIYPGTVPSPSPMGQADGGEVEDYPFTIAPGDLDIEKIADTATANEGDAVEYTITVTNAGASAASAVSISDDLADVLDDAVYVSGSADIGSLVNTAGVLTWTGDLAAGQTATITYSVRVTSTPAGDRELDNVVIDTSRVGVPTSNCGPTSTDPDCDATVALSTPADFGDAPAGYGTPDHDLLGFDGTAFTSSLSLGATVDSEPAASADDGSDEDAATFANVVSTASTYSLTVAVRNTTGSAATLAGWIDFNNNGAFDSGERATVSVPSAATAVQLQWSSFTTAPASTFARLRLFPGVMASPLPTGAALGGEVEDYAVTIVVPPAAILAFTGGVLPPVGIIAALLLGLGLPLALRRRRAASS
ncbi:hypothetical protein BH10ACT7_BH10ACT7_08110 [soil metagenome]